MVPIGTPVKDKISNDFWKEIFYNVYKSCLLKTESDIFNTPLWFNSKLAKNKFFRSICEQGFVPSEVLILYTVCYPGPIHICFFV